MPKNIPGDACWLVYDITWILGPQNTLLIAMSEINQHGTRVFYVTNCTNLAN